MCTTAPHRVHTSKCEHKNKFYILEEEPKFEGRIIQSNYIKDENEQNWTENETEESQNQHAEEEPLSSGSCDTDTHNKTEMTQLVATIVGHPLPVITWYVQTMMICVNIQNIFEIEKQCVCYACVLSNNIFSLYRCQLLTVRLSL